MRELEIGKVYRHFKGNYYFVVDIAIHSETKEQFVVYKSLYKESKTYIRPLEMFLDKIDVHKQGNITGQAYRFVLDDTIIKDYTQL